MSSTWPELADAWVAAGLPEKSMPIEVVEDNWTPALLAEMLTYVPFVIERRTGMWDGCEGVYQPVEIEVAERLVWVAKHLHEGLSRTRGTGWPVDRSMPWLALVAGSPTLADYYVLYGRASTRGTAGPGGPSTEPEVPLVAAWSGVPGTVGALAYAAGLTPAEAEAWHASAGGDVEGLLTLATLRGWVFPDGAMRP